MSEDISAETIQKVQNSLSSYFQKPPLSEKLLKKPPFRYLHDIVNSVINETGFLRDVYTAKELDSNNVKDKASKISFLEKLIASVSKTTGKKISARPSKIVAGIDVLNTLNLLQEIGEAINIHSKKKRINQVEHNEWDSIAKESEKKINLDTKHDTENVTPRKIEFQQNTNAINEVRTSIEKRNLEVINNGLVNNADKSKLSIKKNVKERGKEIFARDKKNRIVEKTEDLITPILPHNKSSNSAIAEENIKNPSGTIIHKKGTESEIDSRKNKRNSNKSKMVNKQAENIGRKIVLHDQRVKKENKIESVKQNSKSDVTKKRFNIEKDQGETLDSINLIEEKESTVSGTASSARPGCRNGGCPTENENYMHTEKNNVNGRKNQSVIRAKTENSRPPSARPGAPRVRDRGEFKPTETEISDVNNSVNVIEEGTKDHIEDDNDSFITIEPENAIPLMTGGELIKMQGDEQGQLVHQILKTQKDLNDTVNGDQNQNNSVDIEWEIGREREKDFISKEIEKIRNSIQNLTSTANPLGKLFDFLQEDVDEMQKELEHWKNKNEKLQKQQEVEMQLQNSSLEPLRKQLLDIQNAIKEEYELIANIKSMVLDNDCHIQKLVTPLKK